MAPITLFVYAVYEPRWARALRLQLAANLMNRFQKDEDVATITDTSNREILDETKDDATITDTSSQEVLNETSKQQLTTDTSNQEIDNKSN